MIIFVRSLLFAAMSAAAVGTASAHGVKQTAGQQIHAPEIDHGGFWSVVLSPAEAAAHVTVDRAGGYRYIRSDGLPDHQPGQFPNRGNPHSISKQDHRFRVPLLPRKAARATRLGHQNFGVALNGVPFDPLTAEYWNRDRRSGWNVEAMSGKMNLGLDRSNAHVQPNGAYHYHALPVGLIEKFPYRDKPTLIGYAADGFPIYGPYGYRDPSDPGSGMASLKASYRIKAGTRPSGPGGRYDGTYVQDYEYVAGLGNLDLCNGRSGVTPEYPNGTYHYVITASYPFIPRCWVGTPDGSFRRGPGGGMGRDRMGQDGPGSMGGMGSRGGMMGGRQGGGMRRSGMGPPPGGHPDLGAAAGRLGISEEKLRRALGPPPPDFERAARQLGVSRDKLFRALHP